MPTDQPELLSSFQRWKLEDDLKFYATFPQARPGANPYTFQSIPHGDYFGGAGFSFNMGKSSALNGQPVLPESHHSSTGQIVPARSRGKDTESSLAPALHFDYGPRSESPRTSPSSHASSGHARQPISPHNSMQHPVVPAQPDVSTCATPCSTNARLSYPQIPAPVSHSYHCHPAATDAQSSTIIPPQRSSLSPRHHSRPEPPIMDCLPSPSSPAPPSHVSLTQQASFDALPETQSDQWRLPDNVDTPWQYEPQSSTTGTDDHPFSSPLHPSQGAFYRPGRSQSYPHFHPGRHSIRPPGWPMVRTPSPHIQYSTLPSKRQAEKKPLLACLFCRGRKIACGPPDPGSLDPTCK
jgi:hypothetical protein